jgi:LacI family transcriptional regulator
MRSARVTIKDISRRAEVSIATVSKVLNHDYSRMSDETRERVLRIAGEMNYRPNMLARGLVSHKFKLLGLIIPDISNPYYGEMARGMTDEAQALDYNAMISNTDNQSARGISSIQTMAEYNVSGVALTGAIGIAEENLALVRHYRIPHVIVENHAPGLDYCVYVNNYSGSYKAAQLLIEYGHREIAYITGHAELHLPGDERLRGFVQAMADAHLPGVYAGQRVPPDAVAVGPRRALYSDRLQQRPDRPGSVQGAPGVPAARAAGHIACGL